MKPVFCIVLSLFIGATVSAQAVETFTETKQSDWVAVSLPVVERPAATERPAAAPTRTPARTTTSSRTTTSRTTTNRMTARTSTATTARPKPEPQSAPADKPATAEPFQKTNSKIQRFKKKG